MKVAGAFGFAVVAQAGSLQDKPEVMPWAEWKAEFGWSPNGESDESNRRGIYERTVAFITAENAKGKSHRLGVNKFSHLTEEEFVAAFTGKKPTETLPQMDTLSTSLDVAAALDWRTQGVVNPVKDQGQCGSCWAFSAAGTVESSYAITTGKLFSLAEQQLVDCSTEGGSAGCDGGWEDEAMTHYTKYAACKESSYPYTATDGTCVESSCTTAFGAGAVTGTTCTELSGDGLVAGINIAPVSVAVKVDNTFQSYRSGIVDSSCHGFTNHAVIALAYDADSFTIRNSWGSDWGENGYIRMARNTASRSGGPFCLWDYCPALPTMATQTTV